MAETYHHGWEQDPIRATKAQIQNREQVQAQRETRKAQAKADGKS